MTEPSELPFDRVNFAGQHIGPYRVVTELGFGGMGTVYYAENDRIGRRCALKVLHREVSGVPSLVERFFDEARLVNDIRHPNIVDITDLGKMDDGSCYLVMELLEGETLAERLERMGKIPAEQAVAIAAQIARALLAAHHRAIVHRDLKPENIFLTNHPDYPDHVKVLDFGIAKLTDRKTMARTQSGVVMGTPTYMSPEQCTGAKGIDGRSDQYSLGVVLYEMLVGEPPFVEESFGSYVLCHVQEVPDAPHLRNREIPRALSEAVLKALEKHPNDRFLDCEQFRVAIEKALIPEPEVPTIPPDATEDQKKAFETKMRVQRVGKKLSDIIEKRLFSGRLSVPSMPLVAQQCVAMLDKDANFNRITQTLERDPLLASQLLRAVNSPALGGRGRIDSLSQAVSRMGIEPLRALLLQMSARRVFSSRDQRIQKAFRAIWEHCLAVAMIARKLTQHIYTPIPRETAYMAGLLHDVGKPVVGAMLLEVERGLTRELESPWMEGSLWYAVVEETHQDVGKHLGARWKLPPPVRDAISRFHAYEPGGKESIANLIRYSNALARREGIDLGDIDPRETMDAVLQGRELLELDEATESRLVRGLRKDLEEITGEPPRSSGRPKIDATAMTAMVQTGT